MRDARSLDPRAVKRDRRDALTVGDDDGGTVALLVGLVLIAAIPAISTAFL